MGDSGKVGNVFRVIATDIDGTLLRSDGTVSERTLSALLDCTGNGTRLVFSTGRRAFTVKEVVPPQLVNAPLVCANGAEIYEDGELIHANLIPPEDARQIIRAIQSIQPDTPVAVVTKDNMVGNRPFRRLKMEYMDDLCAAVQGPVSKIAIHQPYIEDAEALRARLPDACRYIITCGGDLGEIMLSGVSKATGLRFLLDRWGLGFEDMIAFGDEINDIEMLAECGLGVAMGNSAPEAKAVADRVTLSNDDDGIAVVLEEIFGANGHKG